MFSVHGLVAGWGFVSWGTTVLDSRWSRVSPLCLMRVAPLVMMACLTVSQKIFKYSGLRLNTRYRPFLFGISAEHVSLAKRLSAVVVSGVLSTNV